MSLYPMNLFQALAGGLAGFSPQPMFFPRDSCLVFVYKNCFLFVRYINTFVELISTSNKHDSGRHCCIPIRFSSDTCDRYSFECTGQRYPCGFPAASYVNLCFKLAQRIHNIAGAVTYELKCSRGYSKKRQPVALNCADHDVIKAAYSE